MVGGSMGRGGCPMARRHRPMEGSAGCGCRHHRVPAGTALPAVSPGDASRVAPVRTVSRLVPEGGDGEPGHGSVASAVPTRCEPPPVFLLDCSFLI